MTVDDVVNECLMGVSQFGQKWPTSHSTMYHRVGVFQQQYFSLAARVNPEYFLAQAVGTLSVNGAISLDALADPLAECESIVRVNIEDHGTSNYANGDVVRIITAMEEVALRQPPRMRVNARTLQQVGTDLANVTSIRMFYSERSPSYDETSAAKVIKLPEPWSHLLIGALAIWLCESTLDLGDPNREKALTAYRASQSELEKGFVEHLKNFVPATAYRSRTQPARP